MKHRLLLPLLLATSACGTSTTNSAGIAPPVDDASLHKRLLTLDTHLDTPVHFARPGWDFGARHTYENDLAQVDLGRMDEGALDGGFFVIYTSQGPLTPEGYAAAKAFALKRSDEIAQTIARFPNRITLATRASDAARIDASGKRIAYISIENSYPLGLDLTLLGEFYRRGVRMASPVHFRNNQFADSATDKPRWNGLSPLGREWVVEMNRLGMVVDASHASDDVLDQLIELSKTPVILSHSGPDAIYDHGRNLDDARIRKLAASGGAICVNSVYLSPYKSSAALNALADESDNLATMSPPAQADLIARIRAQQKLEPAGRPDFEVFMRSLLHLINVAGVDHVCFGADWDGGGGVAGFEDISALPKVTARLRAAGYSEADLAKMWSGNVLRLLRIAEERKAK
ncbi:dipeptidase [Sphingomonas sp. AOB5]|uniref:dipeptidase n=1 Tax=Sphingomonas sp. AOB5 TaxID=3034017 RepID=UPI0023F9F419|nr:dipeptidase [Sphingomonas sp. AOB5]MDF7774296.1 dipeptidase [Sphingomonas sp. AOB5]